MEQNKIESKEVTYLQAKVQKAITNAEVSEKKAVVALRVLRNMGEAKQGLERAMNSHL